MKSIMRLAAALLVLASTVNVARADDTTECNATNRTDYDNSELLDGAISACTRILARTRGAGRAPFYLNRGAWKHKKGNYDAAIADFDAALSADPKFIIAYDYKADSLVEKGDLDGAIAAYNMVIRINPNYAAAYYSRGLVYEKKGDIALARESYHAALVPPRKISPVYDRTQAWAQDRAARRLQELDSK